VLGAVAAILGMFGFVLQYTGRGRRLGAWGFAAICVLPVAMLPVAWSNPWHLAFWSWLRFEEVEGIRMVVRGYGPGFWVLFGYSYVLVGVATLLLAAAVVRSAGVYRAQAAVMLFGVIVPWMVSIVDMTQMLGHFYVDTAAATFAVTGLAFFPGL